MYAYLHERDAERWVCLSLIQTTCIYIYILAKEVGHWLEDKSIC